MLPSKTQVILLDYNNREERGAVPTKNLALIESLELSTLNHSCSVGFPPRGALAPLCANWAEA